MRVLILSHSGAVRRLVRRWLDSSLAPKERQLVDAKELASVSTLQEQALVFFDCFACEGDAPAAAIRRACPGAITVFIGFDENAPAPADADVCIVPGDDATAKVQHAVEAAQAVSAALAQATAPPPPQGVWLEAG